DYFEKARAKVKSLLEDYTGSAEYLFDLATIEAAEGDANVRLGQPKAALANYQKALGILKDLAPRLGDTLAFRSFLAQVYYGKGTALVRLDKGAEAKQYFDGVLKIRAELAEVDAGNLSYRALWMVTLARCGQTSKAVRIAEDLGRRAPKSCEIL